MDKSYIIVSGANAARSFVSFYKGSYAESDSAWTEDIHVATWLTDSEAEDMLKRLGAKRDDNIAQYFSKVIICRGY